MKRLLYLIILLGFITCIGISAKAKLRLPSLFSHNMILQRDMEVPVWGWANPGKKVELILNSHKKETISDANGKWKIILNKMSADENLEMIISSEKDTIVLKNISIGEVWICSGQSNMEFQLGKSLNGENEVKNASNPLIKLFTVTHKSSNEELEDCEGVWKICTPENVKNFSAVAYYFAKNIGKEINIPIGIIQATWGGSPIEAWISKKTLESDNAFNPVFERWEKYVKEFPTILNEFNQNRDLLLSKWKEDSAKSVSLGFAPPRKPSAPIEPLGRNTPSGLYNGMIFPLAPYGIRGVIWYQGESNVERYNEYAKLFPALIKDWRKTWDIGDFPFYYVQLPNFSRKPEPSGSGWPELREVQRKTLSIANTGMAVTIDIGDSMDLHPRNKSDVGYRLAIIALANVYGKNNIICSGPLYKSFELYENKVVLYFDFSVGLTTKDGDKLKGFQISSDNIIFFDANAVIENDHVLVWSEKIDKPSAVRYAWGDNPKGNLFNQSGLPASPFLTENLQNIP